MIANCDQGRHFKLIVGDIHTNIPLCKRNCREKDRTSKYLDITIQTDKGIEVRRLILYNTENK